MDAVIVDQARPGVCRPERTTSQVLDPLPLDRVLGTRNRYVAVRSRSAGSGCDGRDALKVHR